MDLPLELIEKLKSVDSTGRAQFPPQIANMVNSTFIEYVGEQHMIMQFQIEERMNNPGHITFGGMYSMFFDMVMGPFSGLETGKMTSSLDLNVTFIKAVKPADEYLQVKTSIVNRSRSFIILSGEARNKSGKLVATATSRMMIMDPMRMNKE